jgi:serine/threonine protein kinase
MPGDRIHNKRYRIVNKLGHGGHSTVWLANDAQLEKLVALKIGTANSSDIIEREINILRALEYSGIAPQVFEDFKIEGFNGVHACYAMTVGANSVAVAKQYDIFSLVIARALSARLAGMIGSLHAQGYCHGGESVLHSFHMATSVDASGRRLAPCERARQARYRHRRHGRRGPRANVRHAGYAADHET